MPVPVLTVEQRQAALAKAAEARRERAELKNRLKSGLITVADALSIADRIESIGKMKVLALLESLPGVGKARARAMMERLEIAESRRLRGLGDIQRQRLLSELGIDPRGRA